MRLRRAVQQGLRGLGYQLTRVEDAGRHPQLDVLDVVVQLRLRENPELFFVQIGASDGVTDDPLQPLIEKYDLRGLSVEPQPRVFERLRANRGRHPGMLFENAIVAEEDGVATLFMPGEDPAIPLELSQAASLDRAQLANVLAAHYRGRGGAKTAAALIEPVRLPSLTLASLLARHGVRSFDLLVLDTMGFDFRIIRQLDFAAAAPAIIQYEERILPAADRLAARELLGGNGYCFCEVAVDTIAVRDGPVRRRPSGGRATPGGSA